MVKILPFIIHYFHLYVILLPLINVHLLLALLILFLLFHLKVTHLRCVPTDQKEITNFVKSGEIKGIGNQLCHSEISKIYYVSCLILMDYGSKPN